MSLLWWFQAPTPLWYEDSVLLRGYFAQCWNGGIFCVSLSSFDVVKYCGYDIAFVVTNRFFRSSAVCAMMRSWVFLALLNLSSHQFPISVRWPAVYNLKIMNKFCSGMYHCMRILTRGGPALIGRAYVAVTTIIRRTWTHYYNLQYLYTIVMLILWCLHYLIVYILSVEVTEKVCLSAVTFYWLFPTFYRLQWVHGLHYNGICIMRTFFLIDCLLIICMSWNIQFLFIVPFL
jgi:hypothetical protein